MYKRLLLFIFPIALLACTTEEAPPPLFDSQNLRDPVILKNAVREKLSGEAQKDLENITFTTGGNESIDFLVTVNGVIPSQENATAIKSAIEEAIAAEQGEVEWLVRNSVRQRPAASTAYAEDSGSSGQ